MNQVLPIGTCNTSILMCVVFLGVVHHVLPSPEVLPFVVYFYKRGIHSASGATLLPKVLHLVVYFYKRGVHSTSCATLAPEVVHVLVC